ncbi:MAG: YfiR family protein [Lentisphaeria bacterium]|jgi:hypothetical protein|nr:YfiR family protein [Lentisphaeria bacterium]
MPRTHAKLLFRTCLAGLLLLAFPGRGQPDTRTAEPEALLAAFVYNFCLFTNWPGETAGPDEPFVLAQAGPPLDPLAALARRQLGERPVRVVHLASGAALPEPCHALVLRGLPPAQRDALLVQAAQRPVLTLSPDPGFRQAGGIVEFHLSDQRMRFRISLANMARARLRIESRLLKLAEPPPAGEEEL